MNHRLTNRAAFTTVTTGGSFEEKVRAMAAAGFTATEIWARDLFEDLEGPEVALRVLRDHGVAVCALQAIRNFEGCTAADRALKLDIARRVMDLANLAGTAVVTLAANVQASADGGTQHLVDDLGTLAAEARQRGLRIAYEAIAWAPHVHTIERALALIEAVGDPALGLQLDVFHPFVRGDTHIALERIPAASIVLVEVADLPAAHLPPRELSRDFRLFPGEGIAPLGRLAADLHASGYAGDIVVEVFNTAYRLQPPAAMAARAWRSAQAFLNPDQPSREGDA
ncbi:sugar phosphate isomerase/epimerase family protein [Pseudorhodoferax sp.]|uniref:sugar phosphate isomerase/epimerase family protein n=1 Tax=Pseudorhodoferax sp. TaxID=1993553 RepID=UPI002DD6309D|nr:sugar phosphate isomerase/epimerase [Pseudorhodoferax sp.]